MRSDSESVGGKFWGVIVRVGWLECDYGPFRGTDLDRGTY